MRNWVQWLINNRLRWVMYFLLGVSFPFSAMFGYWKECLEDYQYTWKSVKNLKRK